MIELMTASEARKILREQENLNFPFAVEKISEVITEMIERGDWTSDFAHKDIRVTTDVLNHFGKLGYKIEVGWGSNGVIRITIPRTEVPSGPIKRK